MSSPAVIYDVLTFMNRDYSNPLVVFVLIWEIITLLFNIGIVVRAKTGWLINPTITKQVMAASLLAAVWVVILMIQFFVQHRVLTVLLTWTGYPLTLLVALQHIELLKLFVTLSDFWTDKKCRVFQLVMIISHIIINVPGYIWPFGFEKSKLMTSVIFVLTR